VTGYKLSADAERQYGRLGIVLYHGINSGAELKEYGPLLNRSFESLWVTERYFHEETFSAARVPGGGDATI